MRRDVSAWGGVWTGVGQGGRDEFGNGAHAGNGGRWAAPAARERAAGKSARARVCRRSPRLPLTVRKPEPGRIPATAAEPASRSRPGSHPGMLGKATRSRQQPRSGRALVVFPDQHQSIGEPLVRRDLTLGARGLAERHAADLRAGRRAKKGRSGRGHSIGTTLPRARLSRGDDHTAITTRTASLWVVQSNLRARL